MMVCVCEEASRLLEGGGLLSEDDSEGGGGGRRVAGGLQVDGGVGGGGGVGMWVRLTVEGAGCMLCRVRGGEVVSERN